MAQRPRMRDIFHRCEHHHNNDFDQYHHRHRPESAGRTTIVHPYRTPGGSLVERRVTTMNNNYPLDQAEGRAGNRPTGARNHNNGPPSGSRTRERRSGRGEPQRHAQHNLRHAIPRDMGPPRQDYGGMSYEEFVEDTRNILQQTRQRGVADGRYRGVEEYFGVPIVGDDYFEDGRPMPARFRLEDMYFGVAEVDYVERDNPDHPALHRTDAPRAEPRRQNPREYMAVDAGSAPPGWVLPANVEAPEALIRDPFGRDVIHNMILREFPDTGIVPQQNIMTIIGHSFGPDPVQDGYFNIRVRNRGDGGPAPRDAIAALTTRGLVEADRAEDGTLECEICIGAKQMGEPVTTLPCGHWFDTECIEAWFDGHQSCPKCRTGIV